MHTVKVLHKLLAQSVPSIHAARLNTVLVVVQALTQGARASVTSLGRGLIGTAYDKHKIKRVDRLLSNAWLYQERHLIYSALTQRLLRGLSEAIIVIDWSPLCADLQWQLLRAAIPVGGRSLTLYEEVHPQSKLGNRKVQHQFLKHLAMMVPDTCRPIIVADSGFKTPFYRYIEDQLDWHWVGRIRGMDFICWKNKPGHWFNPKSLHPKATMTARCLGFVNWVRCRPLVAFMVLIRHTRKHRKSLTFKGKHRQSKSNNVHVRREQEPWVLVASLSLQERNARQIVKIYKTRMQIEEGFRDCKSTHYGLCLSQYRHMNPCRRSILCLIAACAIFVLWCIGIAGKHTDLARQLRVNSTSKRSPYSVIFLARLLIAQKYFRLPDRTIHGALSHVKIYMEVVLCD